MMTEKNLRWIQIYAYQTRELKIFSSGVGAPTRLPSPARIKSTPVLLFDKASQIVYRAVLNRFEDCVANRNSP